MTFYEEMMRTLFLYLFLHSILRAKENRNHRDTWSWWNVVVVRHQLSTYNSFNPFFLLSMHACCFLSYHLELVLQFRLTGERRDSIIQMIIHPFQGWEERKGRVKRVRRGPFFNVVCHWGTSCNITVIYNSWDTNSMRYLFSFFSRSEIRSLFSIWHYPFSFSRWLWTIIGTDELNSISFTLSLSTLSTLSTLRSGVFPFFLSLLTVGMERGKDLPFVSYSLSRLMILMILLGTVAKEGERDDLISRNKLSPFCR